jgi:EpsD family peptidyl-prolyl cis-trans isomerase
MRFTNLAAALLCAATLFGQQQKPSPETVVANVNGEVITQAQLDALWNRRGEKMRAQYDKGGNGKLRFLDNYVSKRLMLQLAHQSDFEKSPAVQAELEAAKESALFDLYVRDVVASRIVTDADVKKFYDEHPNDFAHPARAKVRAIFVNTSTHPKDEARTILGTVMQRMQQARPAAAVAPQMLVDAFADEARQHSEHRSAAAGGELGWVTPESVDPKVAEAAFRLQRGTVSGIIEGEGGLYLLLVEDRQAAGKMEFEGAKAGIREYLMGTNAQKVMEAVNRATTELRSSSKVTLFPENVK